MRAIDYLSSLVRTDHDIGIWPLIVSSASQLLAASVLNAFDNTMLLVFSDRMTPVMRSPFRR